MAMRVGIGALESIRSELEKAAPPKEKRIATSVDMPLNQESRRALTYAAEEAERLNHKLIDATHLALGLLRVEDSLAAKLAGEARNRDRSASEHCRPGAG